MRSAYLRDSSVHHGQGDCNHVKRSMDDSTAYAPTPDDAPDRLQPTPDDSRTIAIEKFPHVIEHNHLPCDTYQNQHMVPGFSAWHVQKTLKALQYAMVSSVQATGSPINVAGNIYTPSTMENAYCNPKHLLRVDIEQKPKPVELGDIHSEPQLSDAATQGGKCSIDEIGEIDHSTSIHHSIISHTPEPEEHDEDEDDGDYRPNQRPFVQYQRSTQYELPSAKPFLCSQCNRRFRRREHLKRHIRSLHTEEKRKIFCLLMLT